MWMNGPVLLQQRTAQCGTTKEYSLLARDVTTLQGDRLPQPPQETSHAKIAKANSMSRFLGEHAILRKANTSIVMSVCLPARLPIRMEQFGFHWTDFRNTLYLSIFQKPVEKIRVSFKPDRNNGYFT
jgi:hypothetical protein